MFEYVSRVVQRNVNLCTGCFLYKCTLCKKFKHKRAASIPN